jgi:phage terminase small subunit
VALTAKRKRLLDEYLIDLNKTQAAIRAGYSAKTAAQIAEEIFKIPEFQEALAERTQARSARTEITQDLVLTDIEKIKRDAMRDRADQEGNVAMINHAAALKACELQGRHLAMWNDKMALSGEVSIASAIRARIEARRT